MRKLTQEQFENKLKFVNNNVKVIGSYINSTTPILIKCLKNGCNNYFEMTPSNLLGGHGCKKCAIKNRLETYIKNNIKKSNNLLNSHPNIAKLLLNEEDGCKYTYGSHKKVDWVCPDCGTIIKNQTIRRVVKFGLSCPSCSDGYSLPNKIMFNLLRELNVKFDREVKFDWCIFYFKAKKRYGLYDFSFELNNHNYIIEMDGGLGHGKKIHSKGIFSSEETLLIDNIKTDLAKINNYEVIRINCDYSKFDYIKNNIIKSKLSELFNLININWNDVFINTMSSEKIKVIKCWNEFHDFKRIYEIFKISETTCAQWLKDGKIMNLCDYDPIIHKNDRR
jgi:predicted RNA-binding Zn-ribbon protein involved in translation (DUF1610 family)